MIFLDSNDGEQFESLVQLGGTAADILALTGTNLTRISIAL